MKMRIMNIEDMRAAPEWMGYGPIIAPLHKRERKPVETRYKPPFAPWEDALIFKRHAEMIPAVRISRELQRDDGAVARRAKQLGLTFDHGWRHLRRARDE